MSNGKTIGELIEEMRLKAGAKEYHGHEYMALERFDDFYVSCDLRTSDDSGGDSHQMDLLIFYCPERYQ